MDKLEAARLSLTPMRKAGSNSAFGARCWRPMEFQYVTLGFSCDVVSFAALILPLIASLRRICFFISALFLQFRVVCPSQVAPLTFCLLLPALLPKGGFGYIFPASTNIGDVFSHSLYFKI
jgi:hypothetical protein